MTEQEVETILQRAHEKYSDETPRIISDNGPQFISRDFKEYIRLCGMTHVRTSPYYPQSNGKLERYHRSIKSECIRPGTPLCLEDAKRLVAKYVVEYNEVRLHSAIGYVTPLDKLQGREKAIFAERDRKLEAARAARAAHRRGENEEAQVALSSGCSTAACYTESTWPEDRATVRTDPSAEPGAKTGVGTGLPRPVPAPSFITPGLATMR